VVYKNVTCKRCILPVLLVCNKFPKGFVHFVYMFLQVTEYIEMEGRVFIFQRS